MSARGDRSRFARSFLRDPRAVGAVLPTSHKAVRDTLALAPMAEARCVVELGAGTGVYTREILAQAAPDARVLAFEIDPDLAGGLERELVDPRLSVINDSAVEVARYLDGTAADIVVSAIPFTSLPGDLRGRVLSSARDALAPDGALLVLQYSTFVQRDLERNFASVQRRISWLNVPPAFLFACRGPSRSPAAQG